MQNNDLIRIELGSGPSGIPGFVHIDAVKVGNVDYVADIKDLSFIKDEEVDQVYSAHALEHISYTEVESVLKEWSRVLKPQGTLTLKMPDLDFLCRAYVENIHSPEEIMVAIFGGFSDYPGGPDGWEKVSGNPDWKRNSIPDGGLVSLGIYTEWGAHKALYTENTIRVRLLRNGFSQVDRIIENDWELHIVATK